MTQAPKDNFSNWTFFLLGSLLLGRGTIGLHAYFVTGQTVFHRQKSIPFNLDGPEAALMHAALFVVGGLCIASGARGLRRK